MNSKINWHTTFLEIFEELNHIVKNMYLKNEGKIILGDVVGRNIKDDQFLKIDEVCQNHIIDSLKNIGKPIKIYSEHGEFSTNQSKDEESPYIIALDPFDGTSLYKNNIPGEWWSVLTIFKSNSYKPIAAAAFDFIREEFYFSDNEIFSYYNINTKKVIPNKIKRKVDLNSGIVIATYTMTTGYSILWSKNTKNLINSLHQLKNPPLIWPNGGSCIYPWLERGIIDAYLMFDEPRTEIDPGLGFTTKKDFTTLEFNKNKEISIYSFNPENRHEKINCYIASNNYKLAEQIIQLI
ncbi:MAG: hypothetical protein CL766_07100 [Chloroflexi bacterium]|jgi:fructose-1,6-bisphosphatase/inositol monophosphatase family enzyme|nr:hypothetical protein [Chloroflexota bacterium]MCH2304604.1 hypothetical protein [SAR202 cluster bacterium]|tara:strand:+ start:12708 stop:13589 length:882 start_codon:yes stop_codon:yes gene_type:complete